METMCSGRVQASPWRSTMSRRRGKNGEYAVSSRNHGAGYARVTSSVFGPRARMPSCAGSRSCPLVKASPLRMTQSMFAYCAPVSGSSTRVQA